MWYGFVRDKGFRAGVLAGLLSLGAVVPFGTAPGVAGTPLPGAPESSVFDLFDRAVLAIVAGAECGSAEKSEYYAFTGGFARVYDAVEEELLGMNPGKTRGDLQMVIGFRTAFLEERAVTTVARRGCSSSEVQDLTELFDIESRLAMVDGDTYAH